MPLDGFRIKTDCQRVVVLIIDISSDAYSWHLLMHDAAREIANSSITCIKCRFLPLGGGLVAPFLLAKLLSTFVISHNIMPSCKSTTKLSGLICEGC